MHRLFSLWCVASALAGAAALLPATARAFPSYGTAVDDYCTRNQRTPAAPYSGDCAICHNPVNASQDRTPLFTAYRGANLDAFCPLVPTNQPPVLAPIGSQTVSEEALLDLPVVAMDPDGGPMSLEASGLPTGARFTDQGSGIGQLLWMPTFDQAGNYRVTIKATDGGTPPGSDAETFTITVGDVNRPPVLASIGNRNAGVDESLAIALSATDPDADALRFGAAGLPSTATLTDHANGTATLAWTPSGADVGSVAVTVTVTDDGTPMESDAEEIAIAVGSGNRPPVLDPIGDRTVGLGETWTIGLTASDPDRDALSFACAGSPPAAELVDAGDGSAVLGGVGEPAGNFAVACTVSDSGSPPASDTEEFVLSMGAVNRPPVLDPIGATLEGEAIFLRVTAHDPDGDALVLTVDGLPTGAEFVDHGNGTAELSWRPAGDASGDTPVVFTATDNGTPPESATAEFTIHLTEPPTSTPPQVRRARWTQRRGVLGVGGGGAPPEARVEVLDAGTGTAIGETRADRYGRFLTRVGLEASQVPCAVAARAGILVGEARRVDRAPAHCRMVAAPKQGEPRKGSEREPRNEGEEESED